jgi:hypothetical protein
MFPKSPLLRIRGVRGVMKERLRLINQATTEIRQIGVSN